MKFFKMFMGGTSVALLTYSSFSCSPTVSSANPYISLYVNQVIGGTRPYTLRAYINGSLASTVSVTPPDNNAYNISKPDWLYAPGNNSVYFTITSTDGQVITLPTTNVVDLG